MWAVMVYRKSRRSDRDSYKVKESVTEAQKWATLSAHSLPLGPKNVNWNDKSEYFRLNILESGAALDGANTGNSGIVRQWQQTKRRYLPYQKRV